MGNGNRVHPMPYPDPSTPCKSIFVRLHIVVFFFNYYVLCYFLFCIDLNACNVAVQPRPMVPKKDIAVYGYGSVAWKDRMDEWKKKQNDKLQVVKHPGVDDGGNYGGDDLDDADLPMWVTLPNFHHG